MIQLKTPKSFPARPPPQSAFPPAVQFVEVSYIPQASRENAKVSDESSQMMN
jgi:hypothetical protein